MDRIECSVWNNGANGWGLKILGGVKVRKLHFRRTLSPVLIALDGSLFPLNLDKKSFWTSGCGELIKAPLRNWIIKNGLKSGDRIWLEILKPYRAFKATVPSKEVAS